MLQNLNIPPNWLFCRLPPKFSQRLIGLKLPILLLQPFQLCILPTEVAHSLDITFNSLIIVSLLSLALRCRDEFTHIELEPLSHQSGFLFQYSDLTFVKGFSLLVLSDQGLYSVVHLGTSYSEQLVHFGALAFDVLELLCSLSVLLSQLAQLLLVSVVFLLPAGTILLLLCLFELSRLLV